MFGTKSNIVWGGERGTPMFTFGDHYTFLIVDRDQYGDPTVSTILRDHNGNIIIDIENNCWEVSSDRTVVWDKNYTKDTIEVLNNAGRPIFHLRILSSGIMIEGHWRFPSETDPGDRPNTPGRFVGHMEEATTPTLFAYPSEEHWGEYEQHWQAYQQGKTSSPERPWPR
jgi:hypothetical protein